METQWILRIPQWPISSEMCLQWIMNEWMNEWMNVYLYTTHMTSCLMVVYNNSIEWDRTSALWRRLWLPLSVHFWSHSPTQPMHEKWDETRDRPPHREHCPLLFLTSACHGSDIHQNKYPIQDDENNDHNFLQVPLRKELACVQLLLHQTEFERGWRKKHINWTYSVIELLLHFYLTVRQWILLLPSKCLTTL